jgi:hypothetical protein
MEHHANSHPTMAVGSPPAAGILTNERKRNVLTNPVEKFVVVRNARTPGGSILAQVQRFAGSTAYYPNANAAHKVAASLGGRQAGYTVESRFIDDRGCETSLKLQAVPVDGRMVIGAH